ncbi:LPS assembly lipoprotein LptE [Aestuariivirga sp.]|uniref:LPS assembly lipoprotein LptE n=1 Tax=Aestuariivirga sp. TaxID=2650926 RepID=UPI0039E60B64
MKRVTAILLIFAGIVFLGGCSYRPLYGTASNNQNVADELARIAIPAPDSRLAQLVRNDLLSGMRPAGTAGADKYRLDLTLTDSNNDIITGYDRPSTRKNVMVSVDFSLTQNGKKLYSGKSFSQVTYDVVRQPFADAQAQTNATERVAHELSDDIQTRLAAYFASR